MYIFQTSCVTCVYVCLSVCLSVSQSVSQSVSIQQIGMMLSENFIHMTVRQLSPQSEVLTDLIVTLFSDKKREYVFPIPSNSVFNQYYTLYCTIDALLSAFASVN